MNAKGSNKKAMRLLSLLLAASLFLGAQGFTVFTQTISGNGAAATGNKEQENDGKGHSSLTEPEAGNAGAEENAEEKDMENSSAYQQDSGSPQQEIFPDGNVSGNNARVGEGTPSNPVHHCTKKDDGTDYTDFSYIYFGSYPQSEVADAAIKQAIDGAISSGMGQAAGTAGSSEGIDVWVNGTKYRRINKEDTNYSGYFDEVSNNNGYRYFKWERIKWRVLQNDGNTLFVVADKAVDCKDYNEEYVDITWENSIIRNWLNNSFYNTAFSSNEQSAIVTQNVVNEDNSYYGTEGGNNTSDKVYLLSISEVTNETYGFCSNYSTYSVSRRVKTSDYANARGTWRSSSSGYEGNCWWWLRSPGNFSNFAAYVDFNGYVSRCGDYVIFINDGVCPALHINLSSGIWSMADDGTSGEGGNGGGDNNRVQAPQASLPGGTYTTAQKITLFSATEGAEIYYTTDGSTPGKENGNRYTGMIAVKDSITLKAVAVKDGMADSDIMEESYSFSTETSKIITVPQLSLGEAQSGSVESKDAVRYFLGWRKNPKSVV